MTQLNFKIRYTRDATYVYLRKNPSTESCFYPDTKVGPQGTIQDYSDITKKLAQRIRLGQNGKTLF